MFFEGRYDSINIHKTNTVPTFSTRLFSFSKKKTDVKNIPQQVLRYIWWGGLKPADIISYLKSVFSAHRHGYNYCMKGMSKCHIMQECHIQHTKYNCNCCQHVVNSESGAQINTSAASVFISNKSVSIARDHHWSTTLASHSMGQIVNLLLLLLLLLSSARLAVGYYQ